MALDVPLSDVRSEARARKLMLGLRCLVCQNQSISDSDAPLAQDLRALVRVQIASGWRDDEIIDYIRSRYGDFVLLRPPFEFRTFLLWISPFGFFILGCFVIFRMRRVDS